jgi:hypothetical protein
MAWNKMEPTEKPPEETPAAEPPIVHEITEEEWIAASQACCGVDHSEE